MRFSVLFLIEDGKPVCEGSWAQRLIPLASLVKWLEGKGGRAPLTVHSSGPPLSLSWKDSYVGAGDLLNHLPRQSNKWSKFLTILGEHSLYSFSHLVFHRRQMLVVYPGSHWKKRFPVSESSKSANISWMTFFRQLWGVLMVRKA